MDVHVAAVKNDFLFGKPLQRNLHRHASVKENGGIQHGSAVLQAVGGRVAPASAPVDTQGQAHSVTILDNAAGKVFLQADLRHDRLADDPEGFRRVLFTL